MPWKIQSAVGERWRLVKALLRNEHPVKQWCRVFGISRKNAYKWKARVMAQGRRALKDHSRRPRRNPRQLKGHWVRRIRSSRQKHATWGPKKISAYFRRQGWQGPCERTIG